MMTEKGFYFGAGPATLPDAILRDAQKELLDWQNTSLSILELGHRTAAFSALLESAKADCRDLLCIPDNYQILFSENNQTKCFGGVNP